MRKRHFLHLLTIIFAIAFAGCSKDSTEEGTYDYWTAGLVTMEVGDNTLFFVPAADGQGMMITFDRTQMTFERLVQMNGGTVTAEDGGTGIAGLLTYQGNVNIPAAVNGKPVTAIDQYAFSGNLHLLSVTIPNTVREIGPESFAQCAKLTTVVLPEGITEIKAGTFCGKSVSTIAIPNSVKTIGRFAFLKDTQLTNITFGADSQLQTIEASAFSGCTALTELTLPATVKSIGNQCFNGCSKLKTYHIKSMTPPVVSGSAAILSSAVIYIPAGSKDAYLNAEYWKTIDASKYIEE